MAEHHRAEIAECTRGWAQAARVKAELKRLPERLDDGEKVINLDRAECAGRAGLLALTDARLLFMRQRMFKSEVDAYPFEDVRALRRQSQILGGGKIVLELDTGLVEFRKLDVTRAQRIVDYVQSRMRRDEVPVPTVASEDVDELKRSLGWINRGVLYSAYRRLPDVLHAGESLGPGSYAKRGDDEGLVVATDRRLLFVPNDSTKQFAGWLYSDLRGISMQDGTTLVVSAAARQELLKAVDRGRAEPIVAHVEPRIERQHSRVASPDEEVAAALAVAPRDDPAGAAGGQAASIPAEPALVERKRDVLRPSSGPEDRALDLNAATAEEFHARLGLDRQTAARAVAIRSQRGSFASPDEFADALELPPHLRVAVRSRATAEPGAQAPREGPHEAGDIEIL